MTTEIHTTSGVCDKLDAAAADILTALEEYADCVRPYNAWEVAVLGLRMFTLGAGLAEPNEAQRKAMREELAAWDEEEWSEFAGLLPRSAIGQLLLQLPITEEPFNDTSQLDKHLAVDVAEALGPDWAQAWYRFIVLVTKLA
jgi:hypothetical protein